MSRPLTITNINNSVQHSDTGPGAIDNHVFDMLSGGLTVPSSAGFDFGTGDFTLEMFLDPFPAGAYTIFDFRSSTFQDVLTVRAIPSDDVQSNRGDQIEISVNESPILTATGGWPSTPGGGLAHTHIAIVRNNGVLKIFYDGVEDSSAANNTNLNQGPLSIMRDFQGNEQFDGVFDEVRISTIARYTNNFTPTTNGHEDDQFTSLLIKATGPNGSTDIIDTFVPPIEAQASLTSQFSLAADILSVDPNYIQPGYIEFDYFEGVQDPNYIEPGYIDFDYFEGEQIAFEGEADLVSQSTLSVLTTLLVPASADLESTATQTATVGRIIEADAEFEALFTPDITIQAIRFTDALFEIFASIETAANLIADIDSVLENIVNLSLQGDRAAGLSSLLPASADLTAEPNVIKDTTAQLESNTNLSITFVNVITQLEAHLDSSAAQTATGTRLLPLDSTLETTATLAVDSNIIQTADDVLAAQATLVAEPTRILQLEAEFESLFTPNFKVNAVRFVDALFELITDLDVVSQKRTGVFGNLDSSTLLQADVNRTTSTASTLTAQFDINISEDILRLASATLQSSFAIELNTEILRQANAVLETVSELEAALDGEIDFAADFVSQTQLAAAATGNFNANALLDAQAAVATAVTVQFTLEQTLDTASSLQASLTEFAVREEQIYIIRPEQRTFVIEAETRVYTIRHENRTRRIT